MPLPGIEIRYVVSWESADDITSRQSEIEVYNPEGQVLNFDRRQMKNLSMPYDSYLEKNLTAYPLPENGQQLLRVYFLPLKTDHAKLTFFIRETINNEAYDFDFKKMPLP